MSALFLAAAPAGEAVAAANQATDLLPVGLLFLVAMGTATAMILLSYLLGPRKPKTSMTPYECGSLPFSSARHLFSVKFYMVAMLFILFDIEAAFLFPWAVAFSGAAKGGEAGPGATFVLIEMLVFVGILVAGLIYVWRRGALEWTK